MARRKAKKGTIEDDIYFWLVRPSIDHRSLCYFNQKIYMSVDNMKLASILSTHPASTAFAFYIRDKIGLKKPLEYPFLQKKSEQKIDNPIQKKNMADFVFEHISIELVNEVSEFLVEMKFDPMQWEISYLVWILTIVIPVPPVDNKIEFSAYSTDSLRLSQEYDRIRMEVIVYQQSPFVSEPLYSEDEKAGAMFFGMLGVKRTLYPSIYLKGHLSKNELIEWVEKNYDKTIKPYLTHDAKKLIENVKAGTIFLGCQLYRKRIRDKMSWQEIIEYYDGVLDMFDEVHPVKKAKSYRELYQDQLLAQEELTKVLTYTKKYMKRFHPFPEG